MSRLKQNLGPRGWPSLTSRLDQGALRPWGVESVLRGGVKEEIEPPPDFGFGSHMARHSVWHVYFS